MSFLFAFSGLLNFIISIFFAVLVFLNGREKAVNRCFAFFSFSVAFWSLGYYFWQTSTDSGNALFWCRLLMAGAIFIPVSYFHFVVRLLNQSHKKAIFFGYFLSLLFLLSDATKYFVERVEPRMIFEFWPVPGIIYPFFLLMFFGYIAYGWHLMIRSLGFIKQEEYRQQIKYVLAGTAIGFLGGSTNFLLWYHVPFLPYGNFLVLFYVVFAALAVLRYHLFEVRLVLTEFLVGIMGIFLLVLPFLMPTSTLKLLTSIIFFLFCFFGYYLIAATYDESKRREDAELIADHERELRKNAEEINEDLKHLDNAKTQFLLSTQHHLRSPLSIIQGYLCLINEESYGKIPPKAKEKITASLEATQKLIQLINDLLDVAHFQMDKGEVAKEPTDLVKLINEIINDLKQTAAAKKIYLRFQGPAAPIARINVNSRGVREAIYNIVDNAIKYTQTGGVTVSLVSTPGKLVISIADTGIGMNEKDRQNLFNRIFERGEMAKNVNINGKGIGLYLAAQMIKGSGGTVHAKSAGWGKGTEFIIELPKNAPNSSQS